MKLISIHAYGDVDQFRKFRSSADVLVEGLGIITIENVLAKETFDSIEKQVIEITSQKLSLQKE